jgi:hypothetical protein
MRNPCWVSPVTLRTDLRSSTPLREKKGLSNHNPSPSPCGAPHPNNTLNIAPSVCPLQRRSPLRGSLHLPRAHYSGVRRFVGKNYWLYGGIDKNQARHDYVFITILQLHECIWTVIVVFSELFVCHSWFPWCIVIMASWWQILKYNNILPTAARRAIHSWLTKILYSGVQRRMQ